MANLLENVSLLNANEGDSEGSTPSASATPLKRKLTQPSLNQWFKKPKDC